MDNISAFLTALAMIASGVCVVMFVSTKTLRDSRDDQEKRITFLEAESLRDKATIASQSTEIGVLRNMVTGADKLAEISLTLATMSGQLAQLIEAGTP